MSVEAASCKVAGRRPARTRPGPDRTGLDRTGPDRTGPEARSYPDRTGGPLVPGPDWTGGPLVPGPDGGPFSQSSDADNLPVKLLLRLVNSLAGHSEAVNLSIPASEFVVFSLGPKTA